MSFVGGQYVDPSPGEDIAHHLQAHTQALQDPIVPPEAKKLLKQHVQATQELQQAQMMSQSMQQGQGHPPVGAQAQNAASGAQPQGMPGGGTSAGAGMPQNGAMSAV